MEMEFYVPLDAEQNILLVSIICRAGANKKLINFSNGNGNGIALKHLSVHN